MFARCARVAPAIAFRPSASELASTKRRCSFCTTLMPLLSGSVSAPLAPLTVTRSAAMVALTPLGRSTGFLATLDMFSSLLHHEQHFAARALGARLRVRHDALGRRDHGHAQAAQHLRQLVLAPVDAQPRAADALDAIDHRSSVVILELDRQRALGPVLLDEEVADVTLLLQHLEDGELQARGGDGDRRLGRGLGVADAGEKIGNGIGHAHAALLTSWPSTDRESRRGWPPRAASCARARTCGTPRASVP